MATANVNNILRVPGRLVKDPSALASAFPHGGTALGLTRDMEFRFGFKTSVVTGEEFGSSVVETIYAGEAVIFAAVLREFDNDALSAIFPNTTTGGSGDEIIEYKPGDNTTNRPGTLLSTKAFKLLFSPRAVDAHPHILIYNAIPAVEEAAMLQASLGHEFGIAVAFHGTPDATGRTYQIGKRADLTL